MQLNLHWVDFQHHNTLYARSVFCRERLRNLLCRGQTACRNKNI
nr:MAG TPA: hypothetical protein [Caudoviricetes sp.]